MHIMPCQSDREKLVLVHIRKFTQLVFICFDILWVKQDTQGKKMYTIPSFMWIW
jgi:hypothetical protein